MRYLPKLLLLIGLCWSVSVFSQNNPGANHANKFEQLGNMLPAPNQYRTASGAPGEAYWQQRADYEIDCSLDTKEQRLMGSEKITYYNNSPNTLRYLWLQLDENEHSDKADKHHMEPKKIGKAMSENAMKFLEPWRELEKYGHNITKVTDASGQSLPYHINMTMMRVELPEPLKPGEQFSFHIDWNYYLIDRMNTPSWGRGGYEYFEKDDNYIYTIVQWFPRMCSYNDYEGWQNKQFTGRGEFALTFGNYKVNITVPEDHMVGATGVCQNYKDVLSAAQYDRWQMAQKAAEPVEMVTLEEAKSNEAAKRSKKTKTWTYEAENVRDFAWTASPKFVWDAMPHKTTEGEKVMCMSYYAKEAYPIYNRYSTKAVERTLKTYGEITGVPYPYPVAISVEAANGMEYPMICFNPGRAEEDGTYTAQAKKSAITVIIHEVGHNWFPMIINSDERQWAWFDEGLNTFLQFLTEQDFDNNFPSAEGPAHMITSYMALPKEQLEPIMTNSENIKDYFANAYRKPATALNILRETVMGREQFDYAFRTYCQRWAFKHPTPADFFRSMEDASAVDLDWFWRGWFFGTDAVDVALDSVKWYQVDLKNDPKKRDYTYPTKNKEPFDHITKKRNREKGVKFDVSQDTALQDFYTTYEPWETEDSVVMNEIQLYEETYSKKEKRKKFKGKNYYELYFSNQGGLVTPVIIEWEFEDGSKEITRVPVEIWRKNEDKFAKVFVFEKEVKNIKLDPYRETADIDESNNAWKEEQMPELSRFQVYKKHKFVKKENPMQKAKKKSIRP